MAIHNQTQLSLVRISMKIPYSKKQLLRSLDAGAGAQVELLLKLAAYQAYFSELPEEVALMCKEALRPHLGKPIEQLLAVVTATIAQHKGSQR